MIVGDNRYDYDFAFFVVNFGWSLHDYESITPKQKALIIKAWEDKLVSDSTLMCQAVTVATINAHRKKGKQPQRLWKKQPKNTDTEAIKFDLNDFMQKEREKGKSWVQKIRGKK